MKSRLLLLFAVLSVLLAGCWIEDAPESKDKELSIVADYLTAEDSTTIQRFAKEQKVNVRFECLSPDAILHRIRTRKYNADIDVIITEDEELRTELMRMKKLRPLQNERLFSKLDRQFNVRHRLWVPVAHDPLILCKPKDSLQHCPAVDFSSWHRSDSMYPKLLLPRGKRSDHYRTQLLPSRYSWLVQPPAKARFSTEKVYALSDYVSRVYFRNDSTRIAVNAACRYYLANKKRTFSTTCTLSIFTYGRNVAIADRFIAFCSANAYSFASGRNQLPVSKKLDANWYIRSLSVQ